MTFVRKADLLQSDHFLNNGYLNEQSGFMTVDLTKEPKSVLNELLDGRENTQTINIGAKTNNKIENCMNLGK